MRDWSGDAFLRHYQSIAIVRDMCYSQITNLPLKQKYLFIYLFILQFGKFHCISLSICAKLGPGAVMIYWKEIVRGIVITVWIR